MSRNRIARSVEMEKEFFESVHQERDLLSGLLRHGAQLMLQRVLEEEVTYFLGRGHYQRRQGDKTTGYRNGYQEAKVSSGEGSVEIGIPKVRQTEKPFHSKFLSLWQRRSEQLEKLIPLLYIKGLSSRDIEDSLREGLKIKKVSRSVVSRLSQRLAKDFKRWRDRELSGKKIVYLFLDGIYLALRQGTDEKECVLVAWGITEEGKKVLLHLALGERESYDAWKGFLEDMLIRGLNEPLLVISDRNPGLRRSIRECFPRSLRQHCQVHKMRNILSKLPRNMQAEMNRLLGMVFRAKSYEKGIRLGRELIKQFKDRFPSAMECLEKDLEETLTCLKFPELHRKTIRTTNLLERLIQEAKRRAKVIPRFPTEKSCIILIYSVMVDASKRWQGVKMTPKVLAQLKALWEEKMPKPSYRTEGFATEKKEERALALVG